MQSVNFEAGDIILAEGEDGDTAYLISSGQVEVSIGQGAARKVVGTLGPGEVFGEMSLIEPGPRSATVKALTDTACIVTTYGEFMGAAQTDLNSAMALMKTLVRRQRQTSEHVASMNPGIRHRIEQCLTVILAGLDQHDGLSGQEMQSLQRELKMLLKADRLQVAREEITKAEDVLSYMLRPTIEQCLDLWFGKAEATDKEIWDRFGADVALASRGHYDLWALNVEYPRLLVALVIMLDQFPRNMYRDTPQMYAADARCQSLVKRSLKVGVAEKLRPIERVFLCLVLTHSESIEDQQLCMVLWEESMAQLAPDDPLNVFHDVFHRHVAVIARFGRFPHRNKILDRVNTAAEEAFLSDNSFRFDLPLQRNPDGTLAFAGTVTRRVKVLDHEYETQMPLRGETAGPSEYAYENPDSVFTRTRQQLTHQGFVRIGDQVPDFSAMTSLGPMRFHEFIDGFWCVLFSHPSDFTPVCTTELGLTARLDDEWRKRGTKVIGLSVDGTAEHGRWIEDINATQNTTVNFPIIADKDRKISMLFGMLDATNFGHGANLGETVTVRSVFIISPAKQVALVMTYPAFVGRNFDEILRVIDALQLSSKYHVATPANWQPGEDTVVLPFISDADVESMFGTDSGFRRERSYLRYVRDPSLQLLKS